MRRKTHDVGPMQSKADVKPALSAGRPRRSKLTKQQTNTKNRTEWNVDLQCVHKKKQSTTF